MPSRILREGFIDSTAINRLTNFAECFYVRLLLRVDDAGRYEADAMLLRSMLFPRKANVSETSIKDAVKELIKNNLAVHYTVGIKHYLQLTNVQRCGRTMNSDYPDSTGDYNIHYACIKTVDGMKDFISTSLSDYWETCTALELDLQDGIVSGKDKKKPKAMTKTSFTKIEIDRIYKEYPRHVGKIKAHYEIEQALRRMEISWKDNTFQKMLDTVREFAKSDVGTGKWCPLPATWFHQGRYEDNQDEWKCKDKKTRPGQGKAESELK